MMVLTVAATGRYWIYRRATFLQWHLALSLV